jgi:hypothetical protein
MMKSWKSPFKAFGPRGWGPVDGDAASGEETSAPAPSSSADPSIVRLRNVMAELKVGDAQYDARKGGQASGDQIRISDPSEPATPQASDQAPAAASNGQTAAASSNGSSNGASSNGASSNGTSSNGTGANGAASNGVASNGAAASAHSNGAASSNGTSAPSNGVAATPAAGPSEETLSAAQKLIREQRKAAEALLLEACVLEERLKGEAKVAQATGEYSAAREKAEAALRLEQQAKDAARAVSDQRTTVATERRDAENAVAAARGDVKTSKTRVVELEQQLRDAKQAAEQALSMVGLREARVKECIAKEATAKRDGSEATARVVACETARMEAEKLAAAAEERVAKIKGNRSDPASDLAGLDDVRALAERIAKQASTLKNGAHTGAVESEPAKAAS